MKIDMKLIGAMCLMVLGLMVVTSCGGDDDDDIGGGSPNTGAGVLDHESNLRITKAGNFGYYYKENGSLDYITEDRDRYEFSYSPNRITYVDGYDNEKNIIDVSYSNGLLSAASVKDSGSEDGDKWESNSKVEFSYDSNSHLKKITSSYKETGVEDGERYSVSGSASWTFNWKNNLLGSIEMTNKESDGWSSTDTYTFIYDKDALDNNHNVHHQWAQSLTFVFDDGYGGYIETALALVGLLGRGPLYLPSGLKYEYKEYDSDGDSSSGGRDYSFSYGFNSDGSIYRCYALGSYHYFSYGSIEDTRATAFQPIFGEKKEPHKGLFIRRHHAKH